MKMISTILAVCLSVACISANASSMSCDGVSMKYKLLDHISRDFSLYSAYRDGVIQQARYQGNSKELSIFKQEYVKERNYYHGELLGRLVEAKYFFNNSTQELINNFIAWDREHKTDTINDKSLPTTTQYDDWQNKLLASMMKQLSSDKLTK